MIIIKQAPKLKMLNSRFNSKLRSLLSRSVAQISSNNYEGFEADFQKNRVPINNFQRGLLSVGSAFISLVDPYRADMIACLGETTGSSAIAYMMKRMESSDEGSEILRLRPRINTKTVDLDKLKTLPEDTLGGTYVKFLEKNNVTPDSRMDVQFIDDVNAAYVLQRYREAHDLIHAVLGMPTNMLGEVTVKWFEAIQTKLPMCIGAAIFGPVRLKPKNRAFYIKYCLPWAIETAQNSKFLLNTFFERRWEQPLSELHKELNIKPLVLPTK
jgi:ubiquinone biosynthesis protein COQ4